MAGETNLKLNVQKKDMLGADEHEFIKKVNEVYKECIGYESYAETTEFYDEDGVVLMTATQISANKIEFAFSDDGETFEYETVKQNDQETTKETA